MPDPTYIGKNISQAQEASDRSVIIDKKGISSAREVYTIGWDQAVSFAARKYYHPDFRWLVRSKATVTREAAGIAKVVIDYEGIDPSQGGGQGESKSYSLDVNTNSEPIETHPDFRQWAGQAVVGGGTNPQTGAIWDEDGAFLGFAIEKAGEDSDSIYADPNVDKAGVKSFLSPGVTYTESITNSDSRGSNVDLEKVGKIDTPTKSDVLPKIPSNRNWLLMGASVKEVGNGVAIDYKWKLSGPKGWNEDIYGTPGN